MASNTTAVVVLVTTATEKEALRIGEALLEARLVACANIIPKIRSIYRWEGKTVDESEFLILLKTRQGLFRKLEQAVKKLHSYKTPEIIALPILIGSAQYLGWIHAETDNLLENKRS